MSTIHPRPLPFHRRRSFGGMLAFYRSHFRPMQVASRSMRTLARVFSLFSSSSIAQSKALRQSLSLLSFVAGAVSGLMYMIWLFKDIMFNTIR